MEQKREIITSGQAGEILGLSDQSVRGMADRGELPGWRPNDKQWRFYKDDIERHLEAKKNEGGTA
jgi:excisionase family DNA binding protein